MAGAIGMVTAPDDAAPRPRPHSAAEEPLICPYRRPDRAGFLAEHAAIVLNVYANATTLRREWAMVPRARAASVPIPELLGFTVGPPAAIATRRGIVHPLGAEAPRTAHEAGQSHARFDRLGASPPFSGREARRERPIVTWVEREFPHRGRLGALDGDAIASPHAHFARQASLLTDRPIVLLHGALVAGRLLFGDRRVVAFLDFDDLQPGDPLLDLAVLTRRGRRRQSW